MSVTQLRRRSEDSLSRWVCFELAGQLYGLPILSVQEVLRDTAIEPVPGTVAQVLGVINLRGNVVTVLDLRRRLGLPAAEPQADARVVVLDHGGESIGLFVDRVADVRKVIDAAIKPVPEIGAAPGTARTRGVYTRDGDLVTLLEPDSLIDDAQFLG
ncbi:MAG: chemotaxis protein CheW [Pseudomonadota bacterium]